MRDVGIAGLTVDKGSMVLDINAEDSRGRIFLVGKQIRAQSPFFPREAVDWRRNKVMMELLELAELETD